MSTLAVGLMSGTSLDGIDAALVEIADSTTIELVGFEMTAYTTEEREAIRNVIKGGGCRTIAELHVELGERFAAAVTRLLARYGRDRVDVSFIASHGQTIWHSPGRASLQVGDPAVIAERTGIRVVSDFRSRDIAAGGEGAPLVPIADVMLFGDPERGRALVNLGGMSNTTWVPRRGVTDGVVAFDTGPGMAVVDAVTRAVEPGVRFDEAGAMAARGRPIEVVVSALLEHPYFEAPPPKSTGRETFGDGFSTELVARVRTASSEWAAADAIATAVELTARSIAAQLERWLPVAESRDLIVSGGGVRNRALMARLRTLLAGWAVSTFDEHFFTGDAKEAVAFAYLGWRTEQGLPGNVPQATGAAGLRVLGSTTSGSRS